MLSRETIARAEQVLDLCRSQGLKIATVESCTGGLVCAALTAIAGSSDVVERGFVTYTNDSKTAMVRVPREQIESIGAVSEAVAIAMAEGGLEMSDADIAVAVTGIAGPGGATPTKPVGLVHIAGVRRPGQVLHQRHVFDGDRMAVREAAVIAALDIIARLAAE